MKVSSRRYIGCKTKLLDFIFNSVSEYGYPKGSVFADIFAGTGVVACRFAEEGYKTILNDTLYSNYVIYQAVLGSDPIRTEYLEDIIRSLNEIAGSELEENYFSKIYGDKYFSNNDAKKIGYIRDYIEELKPQLNDREYYCLVATLLYACDRIANTVGHFESFLKKAPEDKNWKLSLLEVLEDVIPADIYNEDANAVSRKIKADIVYIDPPYNARQYVNFYHVLENLARWNKPTEFEGNSMKFKRNELKSDYCRSKAPVLFADLIEHLDCSLIVVSYNNTYKAGSISSVNTISSEQIIETLSKRGKVVIKEIDYRAFNSGKTNLDGHKELLYICEVKK